MSCGKCTTGTGGTNGPNKCIKCGSYIARCNTCSRARVLRKWEIRSPSGWGKTMVWTCKSCVLEHANRKSKAQRFGYSDDANAPHQARLQRTSSKYPSKMGFYKNKLKKVGQNYNKVIKVDSMKKKGKKVFSEKSIEKINYYAALCKQSTSERSKFSGIERTYKVVQPPYTKFGESGGHRKNSFIRSQTPDTRTDRLFGYHKKASDIHKPFDIGSGGPSRHLKNIIRSQIPAQMAVNGPSKYSGKTFSTNKNPNAGNDYVTGYRKNDFIRSQTPDKGTNRIHQKNYQNEFRRSHTPCR